MAQIVSGNTKTGRIALGEYQAQFHRYAWDPETGEFLHMSGDCVTTDRDWAWLGTRLQFRNLRANRPDLHRFRLYPRTTIFPRRGGEVSYD